MLVLGIPSLTKWNDRFLGFQGECSIKDGQNLRLSWHSSLITEAQQVLCRSASINLVGKSFDTPLLSSLTFSCDISSLTNAFAPFTCPFSLLLTVPSFGRLSHHVDYDYDYDYDQQS